MPQRYSNTTMVYRDEQSGELNGLSRVRCITQDDAHVFCRESQVKDEAYAIWDIIERFYKATGFGKMKLRLSKHDPDNFGKYLGTKENWEKAEGQLRDMLVERKAEFFEAAGEAAFYGPKIDFMSYDSLGREWQVATIQIDRNMPESFDLTCVNEKGEKERIVMIHAAIMGSIERFISILLEHFGGAFPLWLAPVQVVILPISDKHMDYAKQIETQLKKDKIRAELNEKNEPLNARVRDAEVQKVPYIVVVGDKEVEANSVAVRARGSKGTSVENSDDFANRLKADIMDRI
jgi:threonyl-tRNA synthetase